MSCIVSMIRYDEKGIAFIKEELNTPIPLEVIKQLMKIEHQEWRKFCFAPFYSLSKFIITYINDYPCLKPYITPQTKLFDFSYQYISDVSTLTNITYITNTSIPPKAPYIEKWIATDPITNESICFFELENSKL